MFATGGLGVLSRKGNNTIKRNHRKPAPTKGPKKSYIRKAFTNNFKRLSGKR